LPEKESYNDKELLLQITEGNEKAFQDLVDTYAPLLFIYLNKLTFNRSLAEELVQDVFLKIWQTRENLVHIKNIKGYLFTITRNLSINAVKRIMRERKLHFAWETYTGGQSEVEPDLEWKYSLIDEAIEQLPPQQKAVLIKSRQQGMKLDEIATEMHLTKTTVKKYLQRALEAIIRYMEQRMTAIVVLLALNNF
jgi:RNA polymerase sigma-70 factor (ECF subfamily)